MINDKFLVSLKKKDLLNVYNVELRIVDMYTVCIKVISNLVCYHVTECRQSYVIKLGFVIFNRPVDCTIGYYDEI